MRKYLIGLVVLLVSVVGVILYNNSFDMTITTTTLTIKDQQYGVEYATPKASQEKPGLLLFIHGDGPATKNGEQGYYPAWETLASENYISLGWDKAGVGESSGDWLAQDMVDRQQEATDLLNWALKHFDVDPNKVGVWGASQGGWVITKLLNENADVKFGIGVAPAVNWLRQGKFNTAAELADAGATREEITQKLATNEKINTFLQADDYQGYLDSKLDSEPLSPDRWSFIHKNMTIDNTNELKEITKPYYLLLGDHDINVDVKETEKIYRQHVPAKHLTIMPIKNATHRMVKPRHQKDNGWTVIESLLNPREIFAPDYFKALKASVL